MNEIKKIKISSRIKKIKARINNREHKLWNIPIRGKQRKNEKEQRKPVYLSDLIQCLSIRIISVPEVELEGKRTECLFKKQF